MVVCDFFVTEYSLNHALTSSNYHFRNKWRKMNSSEVLLILMSLSFRIKIRFILTDTQKL